MERTPQQIALLEQEKQKIRTAYMPNVFAARGLSSEAARPYLSHDSQEESEESHASVMRGMQEANEKASNAQKEQLRALKRRDEIQGKFIQLKQELNDLANLLSPARMAEFMEANKDVIRLLKELGAEIQQAILDFPGVDEVHLFEALARSREGVVQHHKRLLAALQGGPVPPRLEQEPSAAAASGVAAYASGASPAGVRPEAVAAVMDTSKIEKARNAYFAARKKYDELGLINKMGLREKNRKNRDSVQADIERAHEAYERARAEYIGSSVGNFLSEQREVLKLELQREQEKKTDRWAPFRGAIKGIDSFNKGYDKLGQWNVEKCLNPAALKALDVLSTPAVTIKFRGKEIPVGKIHIGRSFARVLSVRTAINLTLLGTGLWFGSGAAIGKAALWGRRVLAGIGSGAGAKKVSEASLNWIADKKEGLKNFEGNFAELAQKLAEMEAKGLVLGKTFDEIQNDPVYKDMCLRFEQEGNAFLQNLQRWGLDAQGVNSEMNRNLSGWENNLSGSIGGRKFTKHFASGLGTIAAGVVGSGLLAKMYGAKTALHPEHAAEEGAGGTVVASDQQIPRAAVRPGLRSDISAPAPKGVPSTEAEVPTTPPQRVITPRVEPQQPLHVTTPEPEHRVRHTHNPKQTPGHPAGEYATPDRPLPKKSALGEPGSPKVNVNPPVEDIRPPSRPSVVRSAEQPVLSPEVVPGSKGVGKLPDVQAQPEIAVSPQPVRPPINPRPQEFHPVRPIEAVTPKSSSPLPPAEPRPNLEHVRPAAPEVAPIPSSVNIQNSIESTMMRARREHPEMMNWIRNSIAKNHGTQSLVGVDDSWLIHKFMGDYANEHGYNYGDNTTSDLGRIFQGELVIGPDGSVRFEFDHDFVSPPPGQPLPVEMPSKLIHKDFIPPVEPVHNAPQIEMPETGNPELPSTPMSPDPYSEFLKDQNDHVRFAPVHEHITEAAPEPPVDVGSSGLKVRPPLDHSIVEHQIESGPIDTPEMRAEGLEADFVNKHGHEAYDKLLSEGITYVPGKSTFTDLTEQYNLQVARVAADHVHYPTEAARQLAVLAETEKFRGLTREYMKANNIGDPELISKGSTIPQELHKSASLPVAETHAPLSDSSISPTPELTLRATSKQLYESFVKVPSVTISLRQIMSREYYEDLMKQVDTPPAKLNTIANMNIRAFFQAYGSDPVFRSDYRHLKEFFDAAYEEERSPLKNAEYSKLHSIKEFLVLIAVKSREVHGNK